MATFEAVIRKVLARCPLAPYFVVRDWVQDGFSSICSYKEWGFLRAKSEFILNDQKTGTVTVTRDSASVTLNGTLTLAATDVGRQFKVGSQIPYTILTVVVGVSCTLDRNYGGDTGASSATVLDAYVTCPSDFGRFLSVLDTSNAWQLRFWISEQELNRWDPARQNTGSPTCLVSEKFSPVTATLGQIRYELWPYVTSAKSYPYYYIKSTPQLTEDTSLLYPLSNNDDILVTAALYEAALWPGLENRRNPYFNMGLADRLRADLALRLEYLDKVDEEVYPTNIDYTHFTQYPYAPLSSNWMQNHDSPYTGGIWLPS